MAATPIAQRRVQCYHCRHRFDVGAQTHSTSCPRCSKQLHVDDVVIKSLEAVRKIQTCGKVVIEKKGRVIAQLVEANEGVFVEGVLDANVISGGLVKIGAKALWKGDCRAAALCIEAGSTISGGYFVVPDENLEPSEAAPSAPP
jgi:cytoskeletal protein CcmA (bactofilin family)